jgi:hypothetical protein
MVVWALNLSSKRWGGVDGDPKDELWAFNPAILTDTRTRRNAFCHNRFPSDPLALMEEAMVVADI